MATNSDIISQLEASKKVFEDKCNSTGDDDLRDKLTTAIDNITDEIGDLVNKVLTDAYTPATDPFKNDIEAGQNFLKTLRKIKTAVEIADDVARAADTVIKIISKL